MVAPKQVNSDGSIVSNMRAFPKLHLLISKRTILRRFPFLRQRLEHDEMKHLDYDATHNADWLEFSCCLIKRDLWDQI